MSLSYEKNEDGIRCLAEFPTTGGIDIGEPGDAVDTARAKKVIEKPIKDEEEEAPKKPVVKAEKSKIKTQSGPIIVGDTVWIKEKKGNPWKCEVKAVNVKANTAKVTPIKGIAGAGKIFDVAYSQLTHKEPK